MIGRPGVGRLGAAQRTDDAIERRPLDGITPTLDTAAGATAQCCLSPLNVIHITHFGSRREQKKEGSRRMTEGLSRKCGVFANWVV